MAEDSPISVSIAIPTGSGERGIEYRDRAAHFHVIVSNTSEKPQRIWKEWCSWGYFGLTFEITGPTASKRIAEKKLRDWTVNYPSWWTLDPLESMVIDVYFGDSEKWQGFPSPEAGPWTVTMQAVFEFKPDEEARKYDVWTGRVTSRPEKLTFYRKPKPK